MQAISYKEFGDPSVLRLVDVPDPEPGPGQVRVDLRAASVIPADWKLRAGHLKAYFPISLPKIPGRDGAGIVTRLGPGVDYVALGAPVCVVAHHLEAGTYAQAIVRDRDSIVPLPPHLGFGEGAALMHAGICACNILKAGYKVVVHDLHRQSAGHHLQAGAEWADTPRALAERSDVIFTSLPEPADVERVALGPDGLIEGVKKRRGLLRSVDQRAERREKDSRGLCRQGRAHARCAGERRAVGCRVAQDGDLGRRRQGRL